MNTYVTADTHFNHESIIKYCNRPFKNANHMNECIVEKWNQTVRPVDTVYHLGDVGFGTNEQLKNLIGRLNGTKILLIGNHDSKRGINSWKQLGFKEVYKKKIEIGKYILTHEPIEVEKEKINIFGHIHDKPLDSSFDPNNHICISCDVTDFSPVKFELESTPFVSFGIGEIVPEKLRVLFEKHQLDENGKFISFMENQFPSIKPKICFAMPMWWIGEKMYNGYVASSVAKEHYSIHFHDEKYISELKNKLPNCTFGKKCINIKYEDKKSILLVEQSVKEYFKSIMK